MAYKFKIIDSAIVDGKQWYSIHICNMDVIHFIRTLPRTSCVIVKGVVNYVDVSEPIYNLICLKFGD